MIVMPTARLAVRLARTALLPIVVASVIGVLSPRPAIGQMTTLAGHDWCDDENRHEDGVRVCEVREITLRATGSTIEVDARPNGGVDVVGEDRRDVHVLAKVVARAGGEDRARDLVRQVEIDIDGLELSASGPRRDWDDGDDREYWWVSFRLAVPRQSDLDLRSTNGGISIADVSGDIAFRTTNGGVELRGLGGSVEGATTNGGLDISLSGSQWEGEGLDVRTTNGGIDMRIPSGYSARLETGTTNGGIEVDFPITLQGRINRRRLSTDLGSGGKTIRVVTTNGGVEIRKS
jgi:hypothetical protein